MQNGIYYKKGDKPGAFLRLLSINFLKTADVTSAENSLTKIWNMLEKLKQGFVHDLRRQYSSDPEYKVPDINLTYMIGYGSRIFLKSEHHTNWIDKDLRPFQLGTKLRKGEHQPFTSLKWNENAMPDSGQTDLIFQFIAESELGVNRPIVEISKLIQDESLPLKIINVFSGFHREDRRSWIDFHDGINTIKNEDRLAAIETSGLDHKWLAGGTFMAFLKIKVNLELWRSLTREQQEVIVGRNKITGCPIESVSIDSEGKLKIVEITGCPMTGKIPDNAPIRFIDPISPINRIAKSSHIHRTNLNRGHPEQDANNRIFRQGYEFLEFTNSELNIGLNFISFQRRLDAVRDILRIPNWMGNVNFGGTNPTREFEPKPIKLMEILAGGFFAVPNIEKPFPGYALFRENDRQHSV